MELQLSTLSSGEKNSVPKTPFDILNLPSVTLTHIYEYKQCIYCICIYDTNPLKIALNILQKYQVSECIQHTINYWKMLTV